MSIAAPPGAPSIGEVVGSSLRDAASVAKTNLVPAVILILLGTLAGAAGMLLPRDPQTNLPHVEFFELSINGVILVMTYYAIAAAVRTIEPSYRMTFGRFIGVFGYSLLASIITFVAFLCFVVPAWWIGVKVMLAPYTYALTDGQRGDALKMTWNMTTGCYWQTFGMVLLSGIIAFFAMCAALLVAGFGAALAPYSAIVLAPLALAAVVWIMHFQALAYVRWVWGLLPRANVPQAAAAVPA